MMTIDQQMMYMAPSSQKTPEENLKFETLAEVQAYQRSLSGA